MADVKNFGLKGVNADLQMGKGGGRLLWDGSKYLMTTDDGSTLAELRVAAPTNAQSSASKAYVDSVASGLDPKESVLLATTADLAADDYTTGTFTNFGVDVDGTALSVADRLLVKNQADAKENGIYAVGSVGTQAVVNNTIVEIAGVITTGTNAGIPDTSITNGGTIYTVIPLVVITNDSGGSGATATAVLTAQVVTSINVTAGGSGYDVGVTTITISGPTVASRAEDHDGTPTNEVSAGNFTFVESGTVNSDAGFVLQGVGEITLDTDNLDWVQFSGASSFTDGVALKKTGNTLDVVFASAGGMAAATGTAGADLIAFSDNDSDVMRARSWTNVAIDLDFPIGIGGNGLVVRTAAGAGTAVTITADTTNPNDGIVVTNGDGTGGNPTIGLDFGNLASVSAALGDEVGIIDASDTGAMKRATIQSIVDLVVDNTSDNEISVASTDTSIVLTDTGIDGTVVMTMDGNASLTMDDTTAAFLVEITSDGDIQGATLTATGLTSTGVVYNASGELKTEAAFTYNDGSNTLDVPNITGASNIITGAFTTSAGDITATLGNVIAGADVQGLTLTATALGVTQDGGMVFNSAGELAVDSGFTYNAATNEMSIVGIIASGDVQGATLTGTALGNTGVAFSTSGELTTDVTNFSFNNGTETLDATNITGASIDMSGDIEGLTLTATGLALTGAGIVFANASTGELEVDAVFTYSSADNTLTLGDSTNGGWTFDADTQTITGLKANTDIVIVPLGTGEVIIGTAGAATLSSDAAASMTIEGQTDLFLQSGTGSVFIQDLSTTTPVTTAQFTGTAADDEYFVFSSGADFPTLATSNDTDIIIDLGNSTSNVIGVSDADAANYETSIGAAGDGALVTKGYVLSQISSGAAEEATKTTTALISLTSTGTVAFTNDLPDDHTLMSVVVKTTTLSDAATTLNIGYATATNTWMTDDDMDVLDTTGIVGMIYRVDVMDFDATGRSAIATVGGVAGSVGSVSAIIEYRVPLSASEPVL